MESKTSNTHTHPTSFSHTSSAPLPNQSPYRTPPPMNMKENEEEENEEEGDEEEGSKEVVEDMVKEVV